MASADKQEWWFPPYFCDACSRFSDSREDAKVRDTQKKGGNAGGHFLNPRGPDYLGA